MVKWFGLGFFGMGEEFWVEVRVLWWDWHDVGGLGAVEETLRLIDYLKEWDKRVFDDMLTYCFCVWKIFEVRL